MIERIRGVFIFNKGEKNMTTSARHANPFIRALFSPKGKIVIGSLFILIAAYSFLVAMSAAGETSSTGDNIAGHPPKGSPTGVGAGCVAGATALFGILLLWAG